MLPASLQQLTPRTRVGRSWMAAFVLAVLWIVAGWALDGVSGLDRTTLINPERHELEVERVSAIDLEGLDPAGTRPPGVVLIWRGAWEVRETAVYDVRLASNGRSRWTIDGAIAAETASLDGAFRTVFLTAGFHRIEISYDVDVIEPRIVVEAARSGESLSPIPAAALKPRPARNPRIRAAAIVLYRGFTLLVVAAIVFALRQWMSSRFGVRHPIVNSRFGVRPQIGKRLAWAALAVVLAYGALLRLDAIAGRYGPVTSPAWLAAIQTRSTLAPSAIRPVTIAWALEPTFPHRDGTETRYRSDPYTYLVAARDMTSFYGAHFREPVFPFATKIFLWLLSGQDVAVSFASAAFSIAAIWLTYLLGAAIWSRPVGLLAALGLALDYDVISLASTGWRDDAYVAAVLCCTVLMLRWWRVQEEAEDAAYTAAIAVGVAGGLAVLTRIMALSFLVAAGAYVLAAAPIPCRRRLAAVGAATLTAFVIAAPYFVNCWRVYGDPLYTFNVHGQIYSGAEGQIGWKGSTASYVAGKIGQRPLEMLDTVAQGMTIYPFVNKWFGLERWFPGIREGALIAAAIGLALLAALPAGRLALVVTFASLLPFSFTWTVDPDFRFTEHVYPMLLIAAAVTLAAAAGVVRALIAHTLRAPRTMSTRRERAVWATIIAGAAALVLFVERISPSLVFTEALQTRSEATLTAGTRDRWSFDWGWSSPVRSGNVVMRVATGDAALELPLPDEDDYPVTLRMDPFPPPPNQTSIPLPSVELTLNGAQVATIPLAWTPGRVGGYNIVLPRTAVRRGTNQLVFRVVRSTTDSDASAPGITPGGAIGLWYVRVRPAASQARNGTVTLP
jgi:4-amino-4-deoxy-L-arabinose transferase-like glycosyltransferase